MKEAYFQEDSIESLSRRWLDAYGNPSRSARQVLDIERAALLVLDMQEYFLNEDSHAFIPSGTAIIPRLNRAVQAFRAAGRPVLATRHINSREDGGMMAAWWSELITADHPLGNLHPDLDLGTAEVLQKTQYDAFYRTDLEARLKKAGVRQLMIGGVMTHLCCETTARSAFVRGFEVFFLIDGTATYNAELHTSSLRGLAHGCAVLTTASHLSDKD